ncbi:MAG: Gfo/Idh/MocA family protein [Ardenticatenaceae bacterium]
MSSNMSSKLKVGVIGLGMGRYHIEGYQSHPEAEVVAIADLNEVRLNEVGEQFGISGRYTSSEQMLEDEDLDIVSVATPNKFHKQHVMAALEAGSHVLCEKPMAMNAQEAREMLQAAEEANKRIMINFSYRFTEQSMALKEQVDAGLLGDIYFARTIWHRRRGVPGLSQWGVRKGLYRFGSWFIQKAISGGGPLIDLGVHRLDLALWLMGYPKPTWVMGSTYDPIGSAWAEQLDAKFDVEDLAAGFIKFENGATLALEASWAANIQETELMETRLLGTKAGLVQRNIDETYKFEAEMYLELNGSHFDMKLHPPTKPVMRAMYYFVDSILNNTPHPATGEEGVMVMEILDAIYESARTGQPVKIA